MKAAVLVPAPDFHEEWDWAYGVEADVLEAGGIAVTPRPWTNVGDLGGFDLVLPLVAWGYHLDPERWAALLDRLAGESALTLNPIPLLRWNSDKRYLAELAALGVPTVPTRFVEALDDAALADARCDFGPELVVKPPMSASADGTWRLGPNDPVPPSARGKAMMIQPFLTSVMEEGEYSLILFDGDYSHAIVKRAKAGDYRVQSHLGGIEINCDAPKAALEVAQAALAAAPASPAYARVDLIRRADGSLAVIELELIEPSLWLQHAPNGGASFVAAIRRRAGK